MKIKTWHESWSLDGENRKSLCYKHLRARGGVKNYEDYRESYVSTPRFFRARIQHRRKP